MIKPSAAGPRSEDALVRSLLRLVPPAQAAVLGPGDDCAALLPARRGWLEVFKTDAVIEGVHFFPDTPPALVGRKALGRVLSDVAAMGGIPGEALVTIALPGEKTGRYAHQLYRGLGGIARQFGVGVAGGETLRSPGPVFLSVALTGLVESRLMRTRAGARPGDGIFVTGVLGGSLSGHHLRFVPRVREGRWLATERFASAMMDLSDGLSADLPRLADASSVGFRISPADIPCRRGVSVARAMRDGEDYELLFTCPSSRVARLNTAWAEAFPAVRLTRIGEITPQGRTSLGRGFDHFTP